MKTKKLSLAAMQGKLSRAEMKSITGGNMDDGGGDNCNTYSCSSNTDCLNKRCGDRCFNVSGKNRCVWWPF